MREVAFIILRSVCAYALLLVFGRLIGRKMISRITFFDFLIGITLGALAVRIALGTQNSLLLSVIATAVITLLVLVTDKLNLLSLSIRAILDGNPIPVVQNGVILNENLKKARISVNKLFMLLHEKDIFDLSDVQEAIYESNGQLSVIPAPAKQPVTRADFGKAGLPAKMPVDLIVDGRLLKANLVHAGLDPQWLLAQLAMRNLEPSGIFYAGLDTNGALYLSPKRK
jgi:uncharacterized membrane protein YcaP (DUF421 family)